MVKVFVSTNSSRGDYLSIFDGKVEFVDSILLCDKALIFLDSNTKKAKQDINFALDKKKAIVYITSADFVPDKGLEMQLGLETGFPEDADREKVLDALLSEREKPAEKRRLSLFVIAAIILAIISACLFVFLPKDAESIEPEVQPEANAEENRRPEIIEMDIKLQEALINQGIDADCNGFISKDELLNITALDLSGSEITDITGLLYAENLKVLDLSDNSIKEIQALVSLKQLEELNIAGNPVEDYSYLDYLPSIQKLTSDKDNQGKGVQ